jgi:hypothetical protein
MQLIDMENNHILGFTRVSNSHRVLIFANFSEGEQVVPFNILRLYGLQHNREDLLTGENIPFADLPLEPNQFVCLIGDHQN